MSSCSRAKRSSRSSRSSCPHRASTSCASTVSSRRTPSCARRSCRRRAWRWTRSTTSSCRSRQSDQTRTASIGPRSCAAVRGRHPRVRALPGTHARPRRHRGAGGGEEDPRAPWPPFESSRPRPASAEPCVRRRCLSAAHRVASDRCVPVAPTRIARASRRSVAPRTICTVPVARSTPAFAISHEGGCSSDPSRYNDGSGKDHWPVTSMMVAGVGAASALIEGGRVVGETATQIGTQVANGLLARKVEEVAGADHDVASPGRARR